MKRKQILLAIVILLVMNLGVAPAQAFPSGGRSLYVSNHAEEQNPPGLDSNVARFTFDANGFLSPAETTPPCGSRGPVFTPDLQFAYVSCTFAEQLVAFRVERNGALTSIGQVNFPGANNVAIAPDGLTFYVDSIADDALVAFRVGADGQLTLLNRVNSGAAIPKGIAVTPDGRFVYVSHGAPADPVDSILTGFALGQDGSIQGMVAEVTNGTGAFETVITPDGRFLYVAAGVSNLVFGYRIEADGGLTPVPGQPFPSGGFSIGAAISPDGRWIYIARGVVQFQSSPPGITGWAIGADGALTEVERLMSDGNSTGIEFAPDGRHLYVSDYLNNVITVFKVSQRGKLTAIQTLDSGGPNPSNQSIAILPNLGPVALFSIRPGATSSQIHFDGTASSDPDGTVARYLWDFGDGTSRQTTKPRVQHVYKAPGTYEVRLTVIDDEGCSDLLIFTGQLASCVGSDAATTTQMILVN